MSTPITLDPVLTVGDITLVRWIEGHTYESSTGATFYSGADEPSEADAADALANPRTLPVEPVPVVLTPLTVLSRLTPEEEAAFQLSPVLAVAVVRGRFTAAQEIRTDDPRTVQGIEILIANGIITAERAAAIFST